MLKRNAQKTVQWKDENDNYYFEHELEKMHDEMIDEIYEPFKMGYLTFYASDILKGDQPAYRESFNEWIDSQIEDGILEEIETTYDEIYKRIGV